MDLAPVFKGKKVTLLGLGLLGRGIGDAAFLAACGAEVIVTDKKSEQELAEPVAALQRYPNITFHLGGHRAEDFVGRDMIIKAAGVPLGSPEVAAARDAGVPVYMSTALFAKYAMEAGVTAVGTTGTRGKSTIAAMIYQTLRRTGKRVFLGGNVRGVSTLALSPDVAAGDIVVLELDSWQLQGFGELRVSPHVAVFSNLMLDHQNYYKNMDEYFADKANIFAFQKEGDTLVVGASVLERVQAAVPKVLPRVPALIPADWKLQVVGEHNRENASLAAAALRALGLSNDEVRVGLEAFEAVEGRLQFVREIRGIKIYNDNNATTPEATIVALEALGSGITLIVGGSDKGLPLDELISHIKTHVAHVVLLTHPNYAGSTRLAAALRSEQVTFKEVASLQEAMKEAMVYQDGPILFSPAFASFGMFKNEYDRNDQFRALVQGLE